MFHNNINKDETCFRSNNIHLSNKGTGILVANMKSHLRGQANGRRGPEAKGNQPRQLRQKSTDQTNMLKNFLQGFLKHYNLHRICILICTHINIHKFIYK